MLSVLLQDAVSLCDATGNEFARGLSNFDSKVSVRQPNRPLVDDELCHMRVVCWWGGFVTRVQQATSHAPGQ